MSSQRPSCLYWCAVTCHTGKGASMFRGSASSREYVSRDLPYRQWVKSSLMIALFNLAAGLVNLTLAMTTGGWWRVWILCLCAVNALAATLMVKSALKWRRKARLQEAGLVTFPLNERIVV